MNPARLLIGIVAVLLIAMASVYATQMAETEPSPPARKVLTHPGGVILVQNFYVAPDEEIIFTGPVDLRVVGELVIDGVVRGAEPESGEEEAPRMKLSSMTGIVIRGELHAFPGYDGKVEGEDGGNGGEIELRAPILVSHVEVTGGRGGNGAVGGGDGGGGGRLIYYGTAIARLDSPRTESAFERIRGVGRRPTATSATCWLRGGDGGAAGPAGTRPGFRDGGNGGGGGSGTGRAFEEEPWMVYFRDYHHMDNEKAAEALKLFTKEDASGIIQNRFEPVPVDAGS